MISTKPNVTRVSMMLAAPYSGATLFAILLDRESSLCCDGETFSSRRDQICSCGTPQISCDYYSSVASHMRDQATGGWDYSLFRHTPDYSQVPFLSRALGGYVESAMLARLQRKICQLPPFRNSEQDFVDAHREFIQKCIARHSVEVYVDGSKIPRRSVIFAAHDCFDLSAIHLVRDGRGFCASFRKNTGNSNLEVAARRWNSELRKVDAFHELFPEVPLLRVRYEDLCRNLEATMDQVRTFLGVTSSEPISIGVDHDHHVIGNRMRNTFDGTIKEDLSWQETIDPDARARIEAIMADGLQRFSYLEQ